MATQAPGPEQLCDIFSLDNRNKNIILQATTLLNGLLKNGFSCQPRDMQQLQRSDLKLRDIFDKVQRGSDKFVIIDKILYKRVPDSSPIF